MEGKPINFSESTGQLYYHLVTVSCDPRGDRRKAMVKHEIDIPEEMYENLKFERHEIVYGKRTSSGNGFCALVDKDDIEKMAKIYFFEKIAPLLNLRMKNR